ncbi:methylenetetrahydrofolate reductase [Buchnera aphidicola]|uniref:Methylenetetrahydrofolate reductase n=1 Tax=Buchnera aphidicola (Stegophylla sp.) TaxID=2315800 RepID=A0A4D6Y983_9GAMM|nr:5,10-methylenetetrahydrofolate reductase [Buchnera aphidicola (Stegophylla sp.)]
MYTLNNYIFENNIFHTTSKIHVSFEFFPPKLNTIKNSSFFYAIKKLSTLKPDFISITCTSRNESYNHTYKTVLEIQKKINIKIVPHMIYSNTTTEKIKRIANKYWHHGINSIVALRGDYINKPNNSSLKYASNLVILLKQIANFDIFVAAYPEVHPEAYNAQSDLIYLKNKIDLGANLAITQFFFEVEHYLRFRDRCAAIGIHVDIIPGILPIIDFQQLKKFASMTNVYIPKWIHTMFEGINSNDQNISKMIGLSISINIIQQLCKEGVRHFHFYTLNQYDITYTLCHMLGLRKYNNL